MQGRGDYTKRDDYDRQFHSGGGLGLRLAMTEGAHGAGVTQNVNLCDDTFTEYTPARTVSATNDASIGIADNVKLYIATFAGKTRIVWADVCTP